MVSKLLNYFLSAQKDNNITDSPRAESHCSLIESDLNVLSLALVTCNHGPDLILPVNGKKEATKASGSGPGDTAESCG